MGFAARLEVCRVIGSFRSLIESVAIRHSRGRQAKVSSVLKASDREVATKSNSLYRSLNGGRDTPIDVGKVLH